MLKILKHKFITQSLRQKLLLPLIFIGIVLAAGVIFFAHLRFEQLLVEKLAVRAELVANTVNYAAEGLSHEGELQRIVTSLGAEKEVNLILVVEGTTPARILASNKLIFVGKPLADLSDIELKSRIQGTLNSEVKVEYFDEKSRNYEIAMPLLISQPKLLDEKSLIDAVVFVQLDSKPTQVDVLQTIMQFTLLFSILFLALIGYSYVLLSHYVIKPVRKMTHQIVEGQEIQLKKRTDKNYDELSVFSDTLNNAFEVLELQQQDLRESEKRLRSMIDLLPVPLAVNNDVPEITFLNRTFIKTFGYDLTDIPSLQIWWEKAYPDPNYRNSVIEAWGESLLRMRREKMPFIPIEVVVCCKNGSVKNVLASAVQVAENINVVALYDITEHKKIELELARSNADLEQFAYAVSHDMRQPLRMVTSYLKLIEETLDQQLDEETRQLLHFAIDGAKRMDSMILSLLDYSQVDRLTLSFTHVSTRECVDEALLFLTPVLKNSHGKVEVLGEWIELFANHDELTRLLQNLIGNALKYHSKNQPPVVQVSASVLSSMFRVEVKDYGIGIEPSQISRLFKVFSRLQPWNRFEGSGVGLALCRKIVEHHGGHCGVMSQGMGQGSTFWFEIPIRNETVTQS
ncbi:MAG: ATP-binding protein [Methylococcales bacterium]|nr:ATP-binding protein [Methylococcales bacterium]